MKRILSMLLLLLCGTAVNAAPALLSWYQFEQDATDSVGGKDAVVSGTMEYINGPVYFGQHYAAAPDGTNYYSLPLDAYPNGGVGNGMDQFTYSVWINVSHTSDKQRIFGNFNSSDRNAIRLTAVGGDPAKVDFWMRSSSDVSITVSTGDGTVPLNTWVNIVVTYNGSALCMYMDGTLMQEVAYSQTNFSAWDYPLTIMAENMRGTVQGNYSGMIDDLRIYDGPLSAEQVKILANYQDFSAAPHSPEPANGEDFVALDKTLSWTAAIDPNDMGRTNPSVKAHYVWMSSTSDPNVALVDTIAVTNYSDPTAACSYAPASDALELDGVYSWYIEEGMDDGAGGIYPAGDENNITGPVWSFSAIQSIPDILTQPKSVLVAPNGTAQFSVEFASTNTVTAVWYKDGVELTAGGNISISTDTDSSSLELAGVAVADEGSYYCVLTSRSSINTESAMLVTGKMLAWYKFEQDLTDEVNGVDGTAVSELTYPERVEGDYAVSTDGQGYVEMPVNAYPNGIFGNGLDHFTYTFMVNPSSLVGSNGRIIGNFNDGSTTGMQIGVTSAGAVRCFVRDDSGTSFSIDTPGNTIGMDEWSYVTITYDGSSLVYYINGSMLQQSDVSTLTNFAQWQYALTYLSKNSRGSIVEPYVGMVDDLKIYNYAVSEIDAAKLYYDLTGNTVCIESLRPSANYDFNNDCVVNILDFAKMAEQWLKTGLFSAIN